MSANAETTARESHAIARAREVREGILEVPGTLTLHHGGRLEGLRIAWRLVGPANAPVVCALGGISAHRRAGHADDAWWPATVGEGLALDTRRWRILAFDYLGGCGETSGPGDDPGWPSVSTFDQAECLLRLLNHLGIKALRALAGASYGAMVALAFGERYPDRVSRLVIVSGADRAHPLATAWRGVQRQIVRLAVECGRPTEGLKVARALAMSTYRSGEEFAARFAGPPREVDATFRFPAEEYVLARGEEWASRQRAQPFLRLSESLDLHRVDATRVFVPASIVAFREDQLVPIADLRALAARLPCATLAELSSIYGHDAFLKESNQLAPILQAACGEHP